MTPGGWLTMMASLAFVWGLCGWCFYRVLTLPPEVPPDEAVPPQAQDFQSA